MVAIPTRISGSLSRKRNANFLARAKRVGAPGPDEANIDREVSIRMKAAASLLISRADRLTRVGCAAAAPSRAAIATSDVTTAVPLGESAAEDRVDVPSKRHVDRRRRPIRMRAPTAVQPLIARARGNAHLTAGSSERGTVSEQLDDPRVADPVQHRRTRHVRASRHLSASVLARATDPRNSQNLVCGGIVEAVALHIRAINRPPQKPGATHPASSLRRRSGSALGSEPGRDAHPAGSLDRRRATI
jgi:hypothetical protein